MKYLSIYSSWIYPNSMHPLKLYLLLLLACMRARTDLIKYGSCMFYSCVSWHSQFSIAVQFLDEQDS